MSSVCKAANIANLLQLACNALIKVSIHHHVHQDVVMAYKSAPNRAMMEIKFQMMVVLVAVKYRIILFAMVRDLQNVIE